MSGFIIEYVFECFVFYFNTYSLFKEEFNMKKLIITALIAVTALLVCPKDVKADPALNYANNFANVQGTWYNNQVNYYNTYEVPVLNAYDVAMTNQYAQALAARYQSDVMALQSQQRLDANMYQLLANEYAHRQNLNTQYENMKNMITYDTLNYIDTAYYNNQEMVLRTTGMVLGQVPFPQVQ